MARGRMLNKKISESAQMNQLPDDTCRLLATWIIPHLDMNGVFHAEPILVRSQVMPWRADISIQDMAFYISEMERVGLIVIFEAREQKWLYWPSFADNQINLRPDRESTTFPPPPQPSDNAPVPEEPKPGDDLPKQPITELPQNGNSMPESFRQSSGNLPESIPPKLIEDKINLNLNLNKESEKRAHARTCEEILESNQLFGITLIEVCGYSHPKFVIGDKLKDLANAIDQLEKWEATLELLDEFKIYWWGNSPPTFKQVIDDWGKFLEWRQNPKQRGRSLNGHNKRTHQAGNRQDSSQCPDQPPPGIDLDTWRRLSGKPI